MALKLNTAATDLPVTLAEGKAHLRVSDTTDDDLITALIGAATVNAEQIMGRAIMPQKWQVYLDAFPFSRWAPGDSYLPSTRVAQPYAVDLQKPPVTAVDSVKYIDADGVLTTVDPSLYQLVAGSDYTASVTPAYNQVWPEARYQPEAVQVVFSCGYANAAAVPEPIKAWIKLRLGAMYENREATVVVVGDRLTMVELPFFDTLLDPYRVWAAG